MIALTLVRRWPSDKACEGDLLVDGERLCATLEDPARGLDAATMMVTEIRAKKVPGQTAIPRGVYRVELYNSPKHGPDTLQLRGVPGFSNIQIHVANKAEQLEGCIAVGLEPTAKTDDWIGGSGAALAALKAKVIPRMKAGEACYLAVHEEFDE